MGALVYVCVREMVGQFVAPTVHCPAKSVFVVTPLSIVAVRMPESKRLRVEGSLVIRFVALVDVELFIVVDVLLIPLAHE